MPKEPDYAAMIFEVARRETNKMRVKLALERLKHLRAALVGFSATTEGSLGKAIGDLMQTIDRDLAFIESAISDSAK